MIFFLYLLCLPSVPAFHDKARGRGGTPDFFFMSVPQEQRGTQEWLSEYLLNEGLYMLNHEIHIRKKEMQ